MMSCLPSQSFCSALRMRCRCATIVVVPKGHLYPGRHLPRALAAAGSRSPQGHKPNGAQRTG
jgi:hypothetical protein